MNFYLSIVRQKGYCIFFTFCFLDAQNPKYIINNLVEKNGSFYNKMSNKPITGKLFFEFMDNKNIILLPVGKLVGGRNMDYGQGTGAMD